MGAARHPERVTHHQERAVVALLTESTLQKAAESVGITAHTLNRWLAMPHFVEAYRKARREAFNQAIALTQRYSALAINTLAKVMLDANAPTSSKVSAAVAVLRFAREGIELEDIADRVTALEAAAKDAAAQEPQRMKDAA